MAAKKLKPYEVRQKELAQIARSSARVAAREVGLSTKKNIEQAAKAAVLETLTQLGIDCTTPSGLIKAQQDFAFLRTVHEGSKLARVKAMGTVITITVTAMLIALLIGLGVPAKTLAVFGIHLATK